MLNGKGIAGRSQRGQTPTGSARSKFELPAGVVTVDEMRQVGTVKDHVNAVSQTCARSHQVGRPARGSLHRCVNLLACSRRVSKCLLVISIDV